MDLQADNLDLALIWLDEGHRAADIQRLDLARDPLHVVVPQDHKLARKQHIAAADLKDLPLIAPTRHAGTQLYEGIVYIFSALGISPRIVYESANMPLSLNMVEAGQGIAIVPAFLQRLPFESLAYRPLVMPRGFKPPSMTLNLIAPRRVTKSATTHFIEIARHLAKEKD